jgi:hypothetical protein
MTGPRMGMLMALCGSMAFLHGMSRYSAIGSDAPTVSPRGA